VLTLESRRMFTAEETRELFDIGGWVRIEPV
jgi:hypothetical protein